MVGIWDGGADAAVAVVDALNEFETSAFLTFILQFAANTKRRV